jgi:hypothetical protein
MSGITRWEVVGSKRTGLGARYRMLLRVGSAEVGGLIEVVEFQRAADLAWTSITGVDQRGRWRLRPANDGRGTVVTLRLSYGVAGSGIWGWLADQISAPTVRGHLRRSLQQLAPLGRRRAPPLAHGRRLTPPERALAGRGCAEPRREMASDGFRRLAGSPLP